MMTLGSYLLVSALLFLVGMVIVLGRRGIISILIGLEFILNGAALNFVAYSKFRVHSLDGHIFPLFIIVVAAAEAAVGLAIAIRFFQTKESIHIEDAAEMQN